MEREVFGQREGRFQGEGTVGAGNARQSGMDLTVHHEQRRRERSF